MAKLFIMQGIPGSGKSTRALELLKENPGSVRVNKDLLREMIYFHKRNDNRFDGEYEKVVSQTEDTLIKTYLMQGISVIVDDTNVSQRRLDQLMRIALEIEDVDPEVIKMDTSIEECLKRNANREYPVAPGVIFMLAKKAGMDISHLINTCNDKVTLERYIVVDMDGTLTDCRHRVHHVQQKPKNWMAFFAGISDDPLRKDVLDRARMFKLPMVVVSARPDEYRYATEQWLKKHNVKYSALLMRRNGDYRSDEIVKAEILERLLDVTRIEVVIDDRPGVVAMWKSKGLKVIDVRLTDD